MRLLRQLWITLAVLVVGFVASWIYYMPNAEERGIWRSKAHGAIIALGPLSANLYSETSLSCLLQLSFPAHLKLVEWAEGATVEAEGDQLLLRLDGTLDPMVLTRIDALPDNCGEADPTAATPRQVFDVMWAAMDEHYAFFDLHGVDWSARRALAPAPDAQMTDAALFGLLSEALIGLDDGHVQLGAPVGYFSPSVDPDWLIGGLDRARLNQIARDTIGAPLTPVAQTGIEYTLLPNGTGYVLIRHMGIDTPFGAKRGEAMALAFAEVAEALQDANAIIIDLRSNPGGSDTVAFGVAAHFTNEIRSVFTKTTRLGDDQTDPFEAALLPFDSTPLDQPVLVLTSRLTGSAAEILTMALRDMPQVTTMGEPTSGGLSDIMGVKLPNGWDLGLSNQTYLTMEGASFEGTGIPPDLPFAIEAEPLIAGEDPLLRAAFAWARDS